MLPNGRWLAPIGGYTLPRYRAAHANLNGRFMPESLFRCTECSQETKIGYRREESPPMICPICGGSLRAIAPEPGRRIDTKMKPSRRMQTTQYDKPHGRS